ncbi:MAG: PIN domain-containing protein [Halorientalis sp.]
MTLLDSSVIIDMVEGVETTVDGMERFDPPYLTSTICVYETLEGKLAGVGTDVVAARNDFSGVRSLDLTEDIAREAARLQDRLLAEGERMAARDVLIAATARSTGDELVVADADFETASLDDIMTVTNLAD